jgi:hypothetical protein
MQNDTFAPFVADDYGNDYFAHANMFEQFNLADQGHGSAGAFGFTICPAGMLTQDDLCAEMRAEV